MAEQDFTAKKSAFLEAFPLTGTISHAADAVGISRRSHYLWLESDPEYAEAFKEARQQYVDVLAAEAKRRAVDGWNEPVFHKGAPCGEITRYDSTLLIFLLKANDSKYRETTKHEVSGPGGSAIPLGLVDELTQAVEQAEKEGCITE